ncbi:uncharacterized protein [Typha angustifolia]|uniref:uncharacterized protein n=1 Tax=Typha angustifolia TaxID=59011 RepID=UPI003C2DC3F9
MLSESKSLQIKKEDKFYSRLLSKESSASNPSFRVYYGVASGSVPFLWESQPGTPKHPSSNTTIPPLTPPPSYYSNIITKTKNISKKSTKYNLIHKLILRKTTSPSPPPSLSSPSASSSSSSFSPLASASLHRRRRFSSPRSSFSSRGEDDESDDGSPTSTLCFGMHRRSGCYPVMNMKNALLSIVGHGSGQGTTAA